MAGSGRRGAGGRGTPANMCPRPFLPRLPAGGYDTSCTRPPSFPKRGLPAMPIHVACPRCRKEYNLATRLAGKVVRCQACQASITVPGDAADAAAAVQATPRTARRAAPDDIPEALPAEDDD